MKLLIVLRRELTIKYLRNNNKMSIQIPMRKLQLIWRKSLASIHYCILSLYMRTCYQRFLLFMFFSIHTASVLLTHVLLCICRWLEDGLEIPGETKHYMDIPNLDRNYHRSILTCQGTNEIGVSETETILDIECKKHCLQARCEGLWFMYWHIQKLLNIWHDMK